MAMLMEETEYVDSEYLLVLKKILEANPIEYEDEKTLDWVIGSLDVIPSQLRKENNDSLHFAHFALQEYAGADLDETMVLLDSPLDYDSNKMEMRYVGDSEILQDRRGLCFAINKHFVTTQRNSLSTTPLFRLCKKMLVHYKTRLDSLEKENLVLRGEKPSMDLSLLTPPSDVSDEDDEVVEEESVEVEESPKVVEPVSESVSYLDSLKKEIHAPSKLEQMVSNVEVDVNKKTKAKSSDSKLALPRIDSNIKPKGVILSGKTNEAYWSEIDKAIRQIKENEDNPEKNQAIPKKIEIEKQTSQSPFEEINEKKETSNDAGDFVERTESDSSEETQTTFGNSSGNIGHVQRGRPKKRLVNEP